MDQERISFKKQSAVRYQSKDESPVRTKSGKDTKAWCRGKPGISHVIAWVNPHPHWADWKWRRKICTVCGKKFLKWVKVEDLEGTAL